MLIAVRLRAFFFSIQCPDNYDLPMRYQQFLFHRGAREMGCGLCELCRVRVCTTNTRPKNYVMCSAVQWVLKLVLPEQCSQLNEAVLYLSGN